MGRISLPLLNRSGNSLFWSSVWDDKHNYTKSLKEDIFIKMCIPLLFKTRFTKKLIYFLRKAHLQDSEIIQSDILNFTVIDYKNLYNFYGKRDKKVDLYFSRVWVLKYQSWVIIYFFYYNSIFNRFLKFTKIHGCYEFHYNNIFYNYYVNLIKINFNANNFYKLTKNSYIF